MTHAEIANLEQLAESSIFYAIKIVFIYVNVWYFFSLAIKRADVVDVAWGPGFFVFSTMLALQNRRLQLRNLITLFLTFLWASRLSIHIWYRGRRKEEDFRYKRMREDWGSSFWIHSYFQIFLLQGVFMLFIGSPLFLIQSYPGPNLTWLDWLGFGIWTVGMAWETIADCQLLIYKQGSRSRDHCIKTGLWRYSRHPNYFGEVVLWWGFYVISLSVPYGWASFPGPLTLTLLILFVTGIPMLEARYEDNSEYQAYKKKTSKFIPWLPQKQRS